MIVTLVVCAIIITGQVDTAAIVLMAAQREWGSRNVGGSGGWMGRIALDIVRPDTVTVITTIIIIITTIRWWGRGKAKKSMCSRPKCA